MPSNAPSPSASHQRCCSTRLISILCTTTHGLRSSSRMLGKIEEEPMRISRSLFWGSMGLFAILFLLALGTTGCSPRVVPPSGTKNVPCTKKIKVDPTNSNGVDHKAVYVCNGDTLEWDNPQNAQFTVHFPGDCPFVSCADITDSNPRSIKPLPADLTVYKYTITVNGVASPDPHVV